MHCSRCGTDLPGRSEGALCPHCESHHEEDSAPPISEFSPQSSATPRSGRPPRIIGDYEVLDELGHGGNGMVYRARQRSLNRMVALKMIPDSFLLSGDKVKRFLLEAETAANLDHPNIVPIYEIGELGGQHFFSMKLVDGRSLAEMMPQIRKDLRKAVGLLVTVARAVQHAHVRGVIHRDLKPGNILIDEEGQPHVADFGLAKRIEAAEGMTLAGQVLGTPAYMPPEQASSTAKQITVAVDIYSLGAILYSILTGKAPFSGGSAAEVLQKVREDEPVRPAHLQRGVDRDLETICLRCLEKQPSKRYSSAEAFADELDRWLKGEPILARPITPIERIGKWIHRHPVPSGLAGAICLSILLAYVAATQWRHARQQRELQHLAYLRSELQAVEGHFDRGESQKALAVLARLAQERPADRIVVERLVNALRQRLWFLPSSNASPTTNAPSTGNLKNVLDPSGSYLASVVGYTSIQIRGTSTDEVLLSITNAHDKVIRDIHWNSDGRKLVSAAADNRARVWDAQAGIRLVQVQHDEPVYHAEFSPDGTRLATASRDGTARLWDSGTGAAVGDKLQHADSVNTVRFSPDSSQVITSCDDGTARVWNATNGAPLSEQLHLPQAIDDAWFDKAGQTVFVKTNGVVTHYRLLGRLTLLWDNNSSQDAPPLRPLEPPRGFVVNDPDDVNPGDTSPDLSRFAVVRQNNTVEVWNHQPRTLIATLPHNAWVNCVRFAADGQHLATSTSRQQVRLWDASTGVPLSDWIDAKGPVSQVGFSRDSRYLVATASTGWTGWRWEFYRALGEAPDWLIDLAELLAGTQINGLASHGLTPQALAGQLRAKLIEASGDDPLAAWAKDILADENP
jgi:eukaryotic-like serine/threonine-protein kinase